ncbi:S24 family peptidase [Sphingomonas montana]|uniref:S24 family peptidase n=1 Tax=Sphingomonas montana TaxID=1843236 RepID=UPI00096F7FF4|nr:S24 family peptidase [Sphingomonas montana]
MDDEDPRAAIERLCRERGEDFAGLSRLLGRNPAYVQQFVRRGTPRKLDEGDRATLARYFGVSERCFGGPAPVGRTPPVALRTVPMLDVGASAGPGAEPGGEAAAGGIAFDERTLRGLAGGDPAALSMIRVAGDSMLPTLADGDRIMVDRGAADRPLRDGIHVVRIDDALVVKRITVTGDGGRIVITSDNPAVPDPGERARGDVAVIGRVVWVGRRIL